MSFQCRDCNQKFSSLSNFDDHRYGKYDKNLPNYGRCCRTAEELTNNGFFLKGDVWKRAVKQEFQKRFEELMANRQAKRRAK